ncbi:endogenous retrovirus group V member 1 Env polyprotein-like [Numenius arquata]|uniref:endogenous retrovirus group V member 1 Env polyprotein-like n=1 Tax=Numenius arquata TaxID=31919 RepID=UPI003D304F03
MLERPLFIKRNNNTAPKVGSFSFNLTMDLNGTICERGKTINDTREGCPPAVTLGLWLNYSYSCTPDGLWWLCGDGRARKSLPDFWDGVCTLGYVIPQNRVYNHSHPPPGIVRTHWRKVREIPTNPLAERPLAFRSFVRRFFPQLGVSELEKAIVNLSVTVEKIENLTMDAIQKLQTEVSSLSKVVLQNRMALDLITAKEGGVCLIINQSCCSYINQEKIIETDVSRIWHQSKVLHQVSQDDASLGFSNPWERLASWLPNLTWLRQLFVVVIMIIVLGLLVCCMLQCVMWMCKQTGNTYEEWKKHKLRQNIESGKYFAKTLNGNGII